MSEPASIFNQDGSTKSEMERIIDDFLGKIVEHGDSCRVFVTHRNGDGLTCAYSVGAGSFYAQYGQVGEWTIEEERSMQIDTDKRKSEL